MDIVVTGRSALMLVRAARLGWVELEPTGGLAAAEEPSVAGVPSVADGSTIAGGRATATGSTIAGGRATARCPAVADGPVAAGWSTPLSGLAATDGSALASGSPVADESISAGGNAMGRGLAADSLAAPVPAVLDGLASPGSLSAEGPMTTRAAVGGPKVPEARVLRELMHALREVPELERWQGPLDLVVDGPARRTHIEGTTCGVRRGGLPRGGLMRLVRIGSRRLVARGLAGAGGLASAGGVAHVGDRPAFGGLARARERAAAEALAAADPLTQARIYVDAPVQVVINEARSLGHRVQAGALTRAKATLLLASLAGELCGAYGRDPVQPLMSDVAYELAPVCHVGELAAYVAAAREQRGARLAAEAVRLATDRLASPMELLVYAALTYPPRLGGLHLGGVSVNEALALDADELRQLGVTRLTPDFRFGTWPVVLEYQGSEHLEKYRVRQDTHRAQTYAQLGIAHYPLMLDDVRSVAALDRTLRVIVRLLEPYAERGLRNRAGRILASDELRKARGVMLSSYLPRLQAGV